MKISTKQLSLTAILAAMAIIIGLIENLLPSPLFFAPGAKLGLANVMTLVALFSLPLPHTFFVVLIRIFAASFLSGTMSSFMYSLAGGLLSLLVMVLVKQLGPKRISLIGISIMGGIAHNYGQLAIASIMSRTWLAFNYLPFMSIAGIIAGFIVGVLGNLLLQHMEKHFVLNSEYYAHLEERA